MNHLVGLDVGEAVPSDDAEIEALRDFTAVHEAARSASWPADAAPAYRKHDHAASTPIQSR